MKSFNRYFIIILMLPLVVLLVECRRTELCYDHYPKADFTIAWEQEWERDYGMNHSANWDPGYHGFSYDDLRPGLPEWVNLIEYKTDLSNGNHYLATGGGLVSLGEQGDHSFLLYNGDTEYIVMSDIASLTDARASATPRSRSSITYVKEQHPDARSSNPPDILYSAFIDKVSSIGYHETTHLPVTMHPLVHTYVVRYEFEYGIEHVLLSRGALGGMAESVYLRDGRTSDETSIILYDCEVKDYGCEAIVRSFGVPGHTDSFYGRTAEGETGGRFTLNLEVKLTNGKVLEYNFDVSDQLKKQPRGGVIVIKGIRVEDEQNTSSGDSGFDVDLSGWSEVDVDFPDY